MDQDKIEEGMFVAQEGMLTNKIDLQVVFQLLIEKGIITHDDVKQKREYISKQPKYCKSLDAINQMQMKNRENQKFDREFSKYIYSNKKDGDIDFLKNKLGI